MYQTEDIKELVAALSKAQGRMEPAKFNRINPHFKNRYADFTSCMEACRIPLAENGLSIMQYCETVNDKLYLATLLAHVSGQWIKSHFPLNPKNMDSQSIGSAMTYAKRYSLSAILGIVSDEEDDDGEASQGRPPKPEYKKITPAQVNILKKLEGKLDAECKKKIYTWLESAYKVNALEEITEDAFTKVFSSFENAVKFLEQKQTEVVANA